MLRVVTYDQGGARSFCLAIQMTHLEAFNNSAFLASLTSNGRVQVAFVVSGFARVLDPVDNRPSKESFASFAALKEAQ